MITNITWNHSENGMVGPKLLIVKHVCSSLMLSFFIGTPIMHGVEHIALRTITKH
jgi:hypothetical protein